jgi:hypothetical protein
MDNIVRAPCQLCGEDRPLKQVTLMQNIGVLVVRFPKTLSGLMCKECITSKFWSYTLITLFFGWWGVISFFYTLIALPTNIVNFIGSRSLPSATGPDQRA